jgi:hypothetical protein
LLAPLIAGFKQLYPKILRNIEVASFMNPPSRPFIATAIVKTRSPQVQPSSHKQALG